MILLDALQQVGESCHYDIYGVVSSMRLDDFVGGRRPMAHAIRVVEQAPDDRRGSLNFNWFPTIWFAFLICGLGLLWGMFPEYKFAVFDAGIVAAGVISGYIAGGYPNVLTNEGAARQCPVEIKKIQDLNYKDSFKEGLFLTLTATISVMYLSFYYYCAHRIIKSSHNIVDWPIPWEVAIITAVTLAALSYFSAGYAGYIRTTCLLNAALSKAPGDEGLIRALRGEVFRGEQLYEPPGNVFVTVGITATFLGLAVGLVNLDLPSLLGQGAARHLTDADKLRALTSLTSFIGCMGLALGVSMLGVVTSMSAQWLRGHGPSETTEALLLRAEKHLSQAAAPATAPMVTTVKRGKRPAAEAKA